jgi:hypothetical protein
MKLSPSNHPNASMAIISGYIATVIVFACKKAGVDITPAEATTGATALIGLVLFLGRRYVPKK